MTTTTTTASTTASTTAPVRLTRRGRAVLLLLLVALLLTAFGLGSQATQAADGPAPAAAAQFGQTIVQPGESLWSVAQRIAPGNDPREVIAQIQRLNGLRTLELRVGQQLLLPVAA